MPDRLRKAIANMDASFRSVVAAASIQAASVGLVYDQELVWQQGYGLIDSSDPSSYCHRSHTTTRATDTLTWIVACSSFVVRLADENTIYRVGSVTKLITNLMLFQLRDQGKLSLDEPVSVCCLFVTLTPVNAQTPTDLAIAEQKYVPELTWPTPYKNNPGITWRTLAGQIRCVFLPIPTNRLHAIRNQQLCCWQWPHGRYAMQLLHPPRTYSGRCLRHLQRRGLAARHRRTGSFCAHQFNADDCEFDGCPAQPTAPMWQDPHYADGAYAIIGRALESVVGMSYEDYVHQHIFKPLGTLVRALPVLSYSTGSRNRRVRRDGQLVHGLQRVVRHGQAGAARQDRKHHLPLVRVARRPQLGTAHRKRTWTTVQRTGNTL